MAISQLCAIPDDYEMHKCWRKLWNLQREWPDSNQIHSESEPMVLMLCHPLQQYVQYSVSTTCYQEGLNIEIFHLNIMTLLGQSTTNLQIMKGRHLSCLLSPWYFSHLTIRRHKQSIQTKRFVLVNVTVAMLTFILLMWRAPNNASKWQVGFNTAFKKLRVTFQCILQF